MKARLSALVVSGALLLAPVASAEPPVLTASGRVDDSHVSLLAGPQGVGLGFLLARRERRRALESLALAFPERSVAQREALEISA